jgi:hypothetical protein
VVEITVVRPIVPAPFNSWSPEVPSRLASAPVAFVAPARAVIEALALDVREVCTLPVLTAEAFSATSTVTMSFTRLALRSRARSVNSAADDHNEPGEASLLARAAAVASAT